MQASFHGSCCHASQADSDTTADVRPPFAQPAPAVVDADVRSLRTDAENSV
jgi:hypothetical protein